ncbi:hypothetical protein ES702_04915 [subsurface metagenome]
MGRNERAFAIPALCGLIGVVLAISVQMFYEAGIIIDEYLKGSIVLREVQAVIILVWLFIGVAIASTQK